ncbi:glycosyltransferase [Desulfogranum japonicum]|uniref:glycosyltransferase n=1 Tax=Desulfogranum japonicum TaxID=231447 RepID=UPI000426E4CC|nr:glycosyltransferase [Desulfogranum japonicum]
MNKQLDFSVVIPVFNEVESLDELIERCVNVCRQTKRNFEIILIDDGSSDGSTDVIIRAGQTIKELIGILLNRNYGQHAAVFAGLAQSRGSVVVTLDADLQNPPEEIPRLLQAMDNGVDVVGTVRINRQDTLFRRMSSSLVNSLVRRGTGVTMHDYGCMLRAYRRSIVQAMLQCREHSTFIPILANNFARKTAEISVRHESRKEGCSKYSLFKLISLQFDLLTSMSTFPLRLLSILGTLLAAFGITFAFFLLIMRFVMGAGWAAEGVFTLFAVLFVFSGSQFIALGLLGEYIGRMYHDVRKRPRYFVEQVILGPEDVTALHTNPHFSQRNLPVAVVEKNIHILERKNESRCPCLS